MGRKKNPEQTVEQIIAVSSQLFIEKGYEQTSIQDILDSLHLSKGGLYHHFKSKEDILDLKWCIKELNMFLIGFIQLFKIQKPKMPKRS